ncbi:FAD/NAD(P)-binding protein [Paracoccus sp. (in: a-proteobacteria)]|uniref:FAD/NAD(P)-binding protein n=1 Tax=Paracoccus sp. TaxID=267 RepID=UPI0028AE9D9B|nr:FAD/NAD(P)-binding protein [Paracoccus sp. (in: a-proteobacteria)]
MSASFSAPTIGPHTVIIGGGASGVLMATHLLSCSEAGQVTIIEKSDLLGCGIAYATDNPDHLLNTRVHNMSAFPKDPDHFRRWLRLSGEAPNATPDCFVGRKTYGRYLGSLMADFGSRRLHCLHDECIRLEPDLNGVTALLKGGKTIHADFAILATGHAVPPHVQDGMRSGWDFTRPRTPDEPVVIIGTGLSMVDHIVSLIGSGHRGPITCLSRRGLLPRAHAAGSALEFDAETIPVGQPVSAVLRWLRAKTREAEAVGGSWRDVVDGIRPFVRAIWQAWPREERRRFLRHSASWWEVHRHRMPPRSAAMMDEARGRGQLEILKARFERIVSSDPVCEIEVVTSTGERRRLSGHVIDCRGIRRDPRTDSAEVILDLIAEGRARIDSLSLGLDTTSQARLIDGRGRAAQRLFAIGPCARGALWEITAIPDIRAQCADLARQLIGSYPGAGVFPVAHSHKHTAEPLRIVHGQAR